MQTEINLEEELYKNISSNTVKSSLALFINIIVIYFAFYDLASFLFLSVWSSFIFALLVGRYLDVASYFNKSTSLAYEQLSKRFKIYSILIVSTVSYGIVHITPEGSYFHQAFLAMIVAGLSAGAIMALSFYQNLIRVYLAILILPFSFLMLAQGTKLHLLITFLMVLFLVMLILSSKRFYENFSELISSKQEVYAQAHYDYVTQLPNRFTLYDRLNMEISRIKRTQNMAALLFIDLDDFKKINDEFGHEVGDKILQSLAKIIKNIIREQDTIARLGGDEFVLLISNLSSDRVQCLKIADDVASKIHKELETKIKIDANELQLSVSVGIDLIDIKNSEVQTIINNADKAMYVAKEQGKCQTSFFKS